MANASKREKPSPPKSLFEYLDYHLFLREYFDHAKTTQINFSFRKFSKMCGFKSSNFLMLVMNKKSSLSSVSAEKVIHGIGFNKEEAEYFRNLVALNEANTTERKAHFARQLIRSNAFKKYHPLSEAQYRYLGTWYLPVIRSVVGLKNFKSDTQWIADHLLPSIKVEEVEKALEEMISLGLISKSNVGEYNQIGRMVSTPPEISSGFAAQYHRQMLERASESIDRTPREERHLIGTTIALDKNTIVKIKELAEKFRNDVMAIASQCSNADSIYQANLQVFPLFQERREDKAKS